MFVFILDSEFRARKKLKRIMAEGPDACSTDHATNLRKKRPPERLIDKDIDSEPKRKYRKQLPDLSTPKLPQQK